MDILGPLQWRYAVKAFDPNKKLTENELKTLLEALRLTPSSFGLQPWKYLVVENPELREKLVPASWGQRQVVEASHLIVMCAFKELTIEHVNQYLQQISEERNVPREKLKGFEDMLLGFLSAKDQTFLQEWMKKQVYIALGSIMTVCAFMGLDTCPMEGFEPDQYSRLLGLEEMGLTPVLVCPVGHRLETDPYSQLKKVRFPMDQVVSHIQ